MKVEGLIKDTLIQTLLFLYKYSVHILYHMFYTEDTIILKIVFNVHYEDKLYGYVHSPLKLTLVITCNKFFYCHQSKIKRNVKIKNT